jgi:hypothetical protein
MSKENHWAPIPRRRRARPGQVRPERRFGMQNPRVRRSSPPGRAGTRSGGPAGSSPRELSVWPIQPPDANPAATDRVLCGMGRQLITLNRYRRCDVGLRPQGLLSVETASDISIRLVSPRRRMVLMLGASPKASHRKLPLAFAPPGRLDQPAHFLILPEIRCPAARFGRSHFSPSIATPRFGAPPRTPARSSGRLGDRKIGAGVRNVTWWIAEFWLTAEFCHMREISTASK